MLNEVDYVLLMMAFSSCLIAAAFPNKLSWFWAIAAILLIVAIVSGFVPGKV